MIGISTVVTPEEENWIPPEFQCRERLDWDFYEKRSKWPSATSTGFSAANGLIGISTRRVGSTSTYDPYCFSAANGLIGISTDQKVEALLAELQFQCRERLDWDFYQTLAMTVVVSPAACFSAANGLIGISTEYLDFGTRHIFPVSVPRTA